MDRNDEFQYVCASCRGRSASVGGGPAGPANGTTLDSVLLALKDSIDALSVTLKGHDARLTAIENKIATQSVCSSDVREELERLHKRKNIVLVGVKEEPQEVVSELVGKLLEKANLQMDSVKDCFRDGQISRNPDRSRIIKIRFKRYSDKMLFLRQSRAYRQVGGVFGNCFARKDMTFNERQRDRMLRIEFASKDDEFKRSHMIRDLRIVIRPTPIRRPGNE